MDKQKPLGDQRFQFVDVSAIDPQPCPCGMTRRAFLADASQVASLHVVEVNHDAVTHYHKNTTELYYVLEGSGQLELDGQRFEVHPGCSALIKPGCRHRAIGQMKILNVPIPAFDPTDEYFD